MTNPIPRLRVSTRQEPHTNKQQVQIAIGDKYRRLCVADARDHADRVHDICDRIEVNERARTTES